MEFNLLVQGHTGSQRENPDLPMYPSSNINIKQKENKMEQFQTTEMLPIWWEKTKEGRMGGEGLHLP